ncbi:para-aminobenzoate synthase [Ophiobolus disseminans]|uniref:aminodeoxychorismate synthase n=1 Tax=Ophiobolus disseminans TaxID=1469910 RepID=A0A6A6ZZL9_9PLEO|nr:para-aminobenzoate synthase [Ophiobolus disseminans]
MAPAILTQRPKILFLDAYDSFSNNIVAIVEQNVDADVIKMFIDESSCTGGEDTDEAAAFRDWLKEFDAVIAGPGPGWAKCDEDVGFMKELWKLQDEDLLPVLGICLGFQSLCLAFGADIERLNEPKHGIVSTVLHKGQSIFRDVEQLVATQYHSLQVKLNHQIQTTHAVRYPSQLWEPTETCPQLEPLAWDFDSDRNGAVLMGVKHTQKPFWGVQFHPESICTNVEGKRVVQNWWEDAQAWKRKRMFRHISTKTSLISQPSSSVTLNDFRRDLGFWGAGRQYSPKLGEPTDLLDNDVLAPHELASLVAHGDGQSLPDLPPSIVHCATTGSGRLTVADVCELLDIPRHEAIVLESGLQSNLVPMAVGTGRYSIVGLVIPGETLRLHYYAGTRLMQLRDGHDGIHTEWQVADPWPYVKEVMQSLKPTTPPKTSTWAPFWGGLMGYASYEAGLETIDMKVEEDAAYPDVCFAYITRSIVFDHQTKKVYVQSIRGTHDQEWVEETQERIYEAAAYKSLQSTPSASPLPKANPFEEHGSMHQYIDSCTVMTHNIDMYHDKVRSCQEAIADGQSYELCLTARNEIRARSSVACRISQSEDNEHSWNLYKRLAGTNPAPFGAYMRMHNVHILSSSPERYISWDRSQAAQCRPIKGTVQKKPGVTKEMAHAILSSSKERAENLMIVDLTRHQLHGVYGSENVQVSQLMEVEEYETLWQLVSVVDAVPNGLYKPDVDEDWHEPAKYVNQGEEEVPYLGFEAFVSSLPPGSMTGAPKKRSCEILHKQEGKTRRGIYSGVLGYLDVGGAGDFNVVIRTAIKIDSIHDEKEDVWHVGAGGAITTQSTPGAEYEEMLAKFQSTAHAFKHQPPPRPKPKSKRVEIIEPDNPEFAELLANMRGGEELSLDDAQMMLRAVEAELRRRTGGGETVEVQRDADADADMGVDIVYATARYLAYAFIARCVFVYSYRIFLHPLHAYPGPFVAKFTDWYGAYHALFRRLHFVTYRNHEKYGTVFRQGPNRLGFNSSQALHDIYQDERLFKSRAYLVSQPLPDTYNLFNVIDESLHRRKRRLIGQGTAVNMGDRCKWLGLDIIGSLGFGTNLNLQESRKNRFIVHGLETSNFRINLYIQFPLLKKIGMEPILFPYIATSQMKYYKTLRDLIVARRKEDKHARKDLYSFVADLKDSETGEKTRLRDLWTEAAFFIPAGGDTTATTLTASFFHLSRHPTCYALLAAEIRTTFPSAAHICAGPQLASCTYLRACIDETLRLIPPICTTLWREYPKSTTTATSAPLVVDGHVIPPGMEVGVNIYTLHHNATYFPEPYAFQPERWLQDDDEKLKHMRDAFTPFSIGARGCGGKAMAYMEASLTLAKVLWYFDFERTGDRGLDGVGEGRGENEFEMRDQFSAAESVRWLTVLGTLFVPLSVVAGIMSMGGEFSPGGERSWVYLAVVGPVLVGIGGVLGAIIGWQRVREWMGRERESGEKEG